MHVWGKQDREEPAARGVARAAAAGASRQELLEEAVRTILAGGNVKRAGVWLESHDGAGGEAGAFPAFRGMVSDVDEEDTPAEWARLSPEAALPRELLAGKTVEQELDDSPEQPVVGTLVEMRRALWVPIGDSGHLRGVLLAGTGKKHASLPRMLLESVAAELALAMELEDERSLARERHAEIETARRILAAQGSGEPADAILAILVESCTETPTIDSGLGAVFAVIAELPCEPASRREGPMHADLGGAAGPAPEPYSQPCERPAGAKALPKFLWRSGDAAWTRALESEPLASIWRRALEAHRAIAGGPGVSWSRGDVSRVVAIPLEAANATLGILIAGFPPGVARLVSLERLELRAALATYALLRRRRDEEARRRAAWQHALLSASRDAMIFLDDHGEIGELSRRARELVGEALGDTDTDERGMLAHGHFLELFRVRERQRVETWLQQVLTGAPGAKHGDGKNAFEAELHNGTCVRMRAVAPAADGAVAVLLEALQATETAPRPDDEAARFSSLIEWLEEGVVLFDANHEIRAMNSRFAQIAGLAAEETGRITTLDGLIARLAGQAVEPESFAERWRELARGGHGAVRDEIQLLRPVPRVLERSARTILDGSGRRLGRVEIYYDLTAQRVFQAKLLQTEKLAALGQMITGVAHELSNPLTSILGYAQRLLLRSEAAGNREAAAQILQEAERASTILRQLLMTARESRPGRSRVALNQVVSCTMELQRFSLAAENVRVELELDPLLPFVQGDAGQLQQVLMNLIGNARQAIEQQARGGAIRLSTKRIDGHRVALEVHDDGPGIPEAIRARIFDPFFTTKPAGIGTGLGLSIVLGIVREHGGQVRVASPPEGGAIFTLEFPAAAEESRLLPLPATGPGRKTEYLRVRQAQVPRPAGALRSAAAKRRVLVVEDEPTVARLIGDVLEDDGFRVDLLLDGRVALKRAASENYDLVICDMKMPRLNGQRFYKTLARTGNPLREKFLFVTGDVIAAHTHEFLERHHLPHLAKPFRVEELTEKVRRVLDDAVEGQRAPAPAARSRAARK
jgi:signal transduction histidine kinase/FixJ family two-component response regulator